MGLPVPDADDCQSHLTTLGRLHKKIGEIINKLLTNDSK